MAENQDIFVDEEESLGTVTLTFEDDTDLECEILAIFPAGEQDYIALLPLDGAEEEDVMFFRFVDKGEDAEPEIVDIENDDEYDRVADAFDELLDELAFEED